MSSDPRGELEHFLLAIPAPLRKDFEFGLQSLTQSETLEWCKVHPSIRLQYLKEYEHLLQRIPAKWSAYRRRLADEAASLALFGRPANREGRPRNDYAIEAFELKNAGLSYAKVAMRVNQKRGLKPEDKGYATAEGIRKLLKRHAARHGSSPDKIIK